MTDQQTKASRVRFNRDGKTGTTATAKAETGLPEWLEDHLAAEDPLAALRRLGQWLDSDTTRTNLHTVRSDRETAHRSAETSLYDRLEGLTASDEVREREEVEAAKARRRLADRAVKLAEATRLRLALALRRASSGGVVGEEAGAQASSIDTGIREVLGLLTKAAFRYPVEILPTVDAVLEGLTNSYAACSPISRDVIGLEDWAGAVDIAADILRAAPSTGA